MQTEHPRDGFVLFVKANITGDTLLNWRFLLFCSACFFGDFIINLFCVLMSVSGLVPKDLAVSNMVVKATTAANSLTTLNLESQSINGVPYFSIIKPVYRETSGAEIGTLTVSNQQIRLNLIAVLNEDLTDTIPAGATFATVPGWDVSNPVTFAGFLYNPGSATIADAGTLVELVLLPGGNIQGQSPLPPKSIGVISNEGPYVRSGQGPCNPQNGYFMCRELDSNNRAKRWFCCTIFDLHRSWGWHVLPYL